MSLRNSEQKAKGCIKPHPLALGESGPQSNTMCLEYPKVYRPNRTSICSATFANLSLLIDRLTPHYRSSVTIGCMMHTGKEYSKKVISFDMELKELINHHNLLLQN